MIATEQRFCELYQRSCRPRSHSTDHPVAGTPVAAIPVEQKSRMIYQALQKRYSEPHRHYHTLNHISDCLHYFDQAADLMIKPDAVEMAIWFHDVIFDPLNRNNEQQSADFFTALVSASVDQEFTEAVVDMILATRHNQQPVHLDAQFAVDIDLAGLALPWVEFDHHTSCISAEFKHLPESVFFTGQSKFLNSLLQRKQLFATSFFYDRYEIKARSNLQRCIAKMQYKIKAELNQQESLNVA